MSSDSETIHAKVEERIKESDRTALDFNYELSSPDILDNQVYYVTWKSQEHEEDETLCYVLVDKQQQIVIFDDAIAILLYFQDKLERLSLMKRLTDFNLIDLVAGVIALGVTATFIYQVIWGGQVIQELVGIFGIILGYYFGKTATQKS